MVAGQVVSLHAECEALVAMIPFETGDWLFQLPCGRPLGRTRAVRTVWSWKSIAWRQITMSSMVLNTVSEAVRLHQRGRNAVVDGSVVDVGRCGG